MTLDAALALIRAIINDVPVAITTGAELVRLINDAASRLHQRPDREVTQEDIAILLAGIRACSEDIRRADAT